MEGVGLFVEFFVVAPTASNNARPCSGGLTVSWPVPDAHARRHCHQSHGSQR